MWWMESPHPFGVKGAPCACVSLFFSVRRRRSSEQRCKQAAAVSVKTSRSRRAAGPTQPPTQLRIDL